MKVRTRLAQLVAVLVLAGGCAGTPESTGAPSPTEAPSAQAASATARSEQPEQRYPDVLRAELEETGETWRLSATISSPYDSSERYADAFRALDEDGSVLGVRELLHDHANEQPFTRSLDGLEVPAEVEQITVEGRDLEHGWGGGTATVRVPR